MITKYTYDAAGRMVKEGKRTYRYGYLDKVISVTEGKERITYGYHVDGQLATVTKGKVTENFTWDGLALVKRGITSYLNEPHPGGGAPVASSNGGVMFNDILGTTLGVDGADGYSPITKTAFGDAETADSTANATFFTGKPHVDGLGYAFFLRNYRADLGKWPTADPLGYPDGWNQMSYCGNEVVDHIDWKGTIKKKESEKVVYDRPITDWVHYAWNADGSEVQIRWFEKSIDITWGEYEMVYPGKEALINLEKGIEFTATVGGAIIAVVGLATGGMAYTIGGVALSLAGLWEYCQNHENDAELRLISTYTENKYSTYYRLRVIE